MWLCGGANCITVILFLNSQYNSVDASLSIMFNICACPTFSNASYKTSLLVLIGSTKIISVSYAYNINMYCIPLLLVTGKRPVKSVYILIVSGLASTIAEDTQLFFPSLLGKKYVSIYNAS